MAAFPAPDWAIMGEPFHPFVPASLMMRPPLWSIINRASACGQKNVPSMSVCVMVQQPFGVTASAGEVKFAPALFTSTSSREP